MATRKFSRVHFNVAATVSYGERTFTGELENLSMSGMYLITEEKIELNEPVEITISLSGSDPEIKITFDGKVTRVGDDGLAFSFEKIDLDSYTHLKNIISYNIDDAEKVMDEIYQSIDEKLK